jgi:hypothetical protein
LSGVLGYSFSPEKVVLEDDVKGYDLINEEG